MPSGVLELRVGSAFEFIVAVYQVSISSSKQEGYSPALVSKELQKELRKTLGDALRIVFYVSNIKV
jgi:hypothetical protein